MRQRGLTLIELLVSLVILSLLAGAALPFAEKTVQRERELELRRALRDMRTAIDRFHRDWKLGKLSRVDNVASEDGYPRSLILLVEGVPRAGSTDRHEKYLRRIPRDPFADGTLATSEQWQLIGYQDAADTTQSSAHDVYDVRSKSERQALDGSRYRDW